MRIVFAGSPPAAVTTLDYLQSSSHQILAVLSRPDAQAGRGKKLQSSAVAIRATQLDLPLYQPRSLRNNSEAVEFLEKLQPDLGVIVAYGAILPPEILEIPVHGWINVHFSLLPRWRGAAPVQRAIAAGDTESGITVFRLEPGLDTGPIYSQLPVQIPPEASAGDFLEILACLTDQPLGKALIDITNSVPPRAQDATGITYAPMLTTAQAEVDWSLSAAQIDAHIKGFTPAPGAWTTFASTRIKLGVLTQNPQMPLPIGQLHPGQIFPTRHQVWVGTSTTPVCLDKVAPAGKKHMSADAWARGVRLEAGMFFGK